MRDVVVMRFIPPPNSSSSFKVSAIFWDGNFDDIRRNARYLWNCLYKFYISISMGMTHVMAPDEWKRRLASGADLHASERYDSAQPCHKQTLHRDSDTSLDGPPSVDSTSYIRHRSIAMYRPTIVLIAAGRHSV